MGGLFQNEGTALTGGRTFLAERWLKITPGNFYEKSSPSLSSAAQFWSQSQIGQHKRMPANEAVRSHCYSANISQEWSADGGLSNKARLTGPLTVIMLGVNIAAAFQPHKRRINTICPPFEMVAPKPLSTII